MSIRSRRSIIALTAVAGTLALAGCAATGAADPASSEPIQLWVPYPSSFEEPMQAAAELCAANGTPVEVTGFDLSYGELDLKVQAEAQAGNAPDVILAGLNSIIPFGSNDFVVDLTGFAEGDDIVNDETMPVLAAGQLDGKQLIVPWGISIPAVFVNTAIVEAAGVDPADLTSWSAVEEAAATITANGNYGIAVAQQEGWVALQYLLTAGTELVDAENTSVFNDDAGDIAIEHLNALYSAGSAYPGDETASREAFAAGEVGLFIGSSSFIQSFNEAPFEWTTVPFPPAVEGGDIAMGAGGAGLAMFASADRQAAAWEAIKCAMDTQILADYAVKVIGYLPVRSDMDDALEPGLLEAAPYAAPWSQFDLAGPWLNFPGVDGPRALERFNEAWLEAAQRSDDPTAVMDAAADDINGLLK
jgi:ABC-type glycerol-3-phosphate transport system substrate-binding protein